MSRILDFFDGFSSNSQPLTQFIQAGKLSVYASDLDYETAKGSPGAEGDFYWNSTDKTIKVHNGTSWITIQASVVFKKEIPSGTIDGLNQNFTLSELPVSDKSVAIFVNGNWREDAEYSVSGNTITFAASSTPVAGQTIEAWYLTEGVAPAISLPGTDNVIYHTFSSTDIANKKIVLANTPSEPTKMLFDYIGGTSQVYNVDFSVVSNEVVFTGYALETVIALGDVVRLKFFSS